MAEKFSLKMSKNEKIGYVNKYIFNTDAYRMSYAYDVVQKYFELLPASIEFDIAGEYSEKMLKMKKRVFANIGWWVVCN